MIDLEFERPYFEQANQDPSFLLNSIDDALMRADVEELPIVTLSGVGDGQEVSAVVDGVPRHAVIDQLVENKRNFIVVLICESGCYCDFKDRHENTIDVMTAVADALISSTLRFPIPIAMIAAYCVRSLTLDRLCACEKG